MTSLTKKTKFKTKIHCSGNRRDKVALKTTCNKNVKFRIMVYTDTIIDTRAQNMNWLATQ